MALYGKYKTKILGTGQFAPEKQLTNKDLEKLVDTNDEWIFERTGIRARRIAKENEVTSDLAYYASKDALKEAGKTPEDLDLIIFATVSPDQVMPNTACELQTKLGCRNIMAFDLSAACTGFVYALSVADQFIRSGQYKTILVVGAEILNRYVNYKDRGTCILFGDGAGVAVVGRAEENEDNEILSMHLHADGSLGDLFVLPAGGTKIPFTQSVLDEELQYVRMKGKEIFKNAVRTMSQCCQEALDANGLGKDDVDWVIPHQANRRIIEAVAKHFGIPEDKVIFDLETKGNTSAATVPMALDTGIKDGRIKRGDMVLLTAFGAGLTSGSILLRY